MKRGDVVLFDFPYSDLIGSKLRPAVAGRRLDQFLLGQADFRPAPLKTAW